MNNKNHGNDAAKTFACSDKIIIIFFPIVPCIANILGSKQMEDETLLLKIGTHIESNNRTVLFGAGCLCRSDVLYMVET